ncbi:hypothetical protein FVEN_g12026 [Fusarium venenatum]|nr:hypothetical protein FVEN_g12026 [Fusarium venenatum]
MRPARDNEAEMLAHWKPMMILNKTLRGPAYVESLVSQSPTLITSNTRGRRTLPLELCYMILDSIANDPDPHDYALVRPIALNVDGRRNKKLMCVKLQRWLSMDQLQVEAEVFATNKYLARPDLRFNDVHYPFLRFSKPSTRWEIRARVLSSGYKTVHVAITVPDIIKYLEEVRCNIRLGDFYVHGN